MLLPAIYAAGTIGGDDGQAILEGLADSSDPEVARAAGDALRVAVNAAVWDDIGWEDDDPA